MKTALMFAMLLTVAAVQAQPAQSTTSAQAQLYRGTRIIGTSVRGSDDRKIGEIRDLILDTRRGEVAYAVINFGGVLGVGAKYHAVPWQTLERSDNGRYYILRADRKTIADAPSFDRGRWPDMSSQAWSKAVDSYWSRALGKPGAANTLESGVSGTNSHSSK
jgi:sporulation protein YlmC with PRC-barrel domain